MLVSLPGEPGPVEAITNPLALRRCWSRRTSAPVEPNDRLRVNVDGVTVVCTAGATDVVMFKAALVCGPTVPVEEIPLARWNACTAFIVAEP